MTYVCHAQGCAFTGDALLIRGCGRTDFQEGSPDTLYDSVWNQILSLPENFKLFPAHDYKGKQVFFYSKILGEIIIHLIFRTNRDLGSRRENSEPEVDQATRRIHQNHGESGTSLSQKDW